MINLSGKKISIIGGTGFIGSRLVEILVEEHGLNPVVVVRDYRNSPRIGRYELEYLEGDIYSANFLEEVFSASDIVFNLAFDFSVGPGRLVDSATKMAKAFSSAHLKNREMVLVHFGSFSSYGAISSGDITEETEPSKTIDNYGKAKGAFDQILLKEAKTNDLHVTIIEPTVVYGPQSKPWTIGPLTQLVDGVIVLPDQDSMGICNPVYVDDVVQASLLAATTQNSKSEKFLISGAEYPSWGEFYRYFEEELGLSSTHLISAEEYENRLNQIPTSCGIVEQRKIGDVLERTFSLEDFSEAAQEKVFFPNQDRFNLLTSKAKVKIEKAKKILGFSPEYDLNRGFRSTFAHANLYGFFKRSEDVFRYDFSEAETFLNSGFEKFEKFKTIVHNKRAEELSQRHQGETIFIIGNGPSLKNMDLTPLNNQITIGSNGIYLHEVFRDNPTTYWTVEDTLVAEDRFREINKQGTTKIIPRDLDHLIRADRNTIFIDFKRPGYPGFPKFSLDLSDCAYWGGTVSFLNMQIALYLGAKKVVLVGFDHNYVDIQPGDEQSNMTILSNNDDINHFDPTYFGKGYRYHVPNTERMEIGYKLVKKVFKEKRIEIVNATLGGKLNVFKRADFKELIKNL